MPKPNLTPIGEEAFDSLLAWLDAGGHGSDLVGGFNMTYWHANHNLDYSGRTCGTVACMAGFLVIYLGIPVDRDYAVHQICAAVGISIWDGTSLFNGEGVHYRTHPAVAAAVVRRWLETGEVTWPKDPTDPSFGHDPGYAE